MGSDGEHPPTLCFIAGLIALSLPFIAGLKVWLKLSIPYSFFIEFCLEFIFEHSSFGYKLAAASGVVIFIMGLAKQNDFSDEFY